CLLGALVGLIGTFQYSRGPAPLAAILFDLAILATCVFGSVGMRTALGGVLPAVGWFAVTLVLSSGSAGGRILVTNASAGTWCLSGGAACSAAGAVYASAGWSAASRDHGASRDRRASHSSGSHPEQPPQRPQQERPQQGRPQQDGSRQSSGSA